MSEDIGLCVTAYGLGAGIFFIGYAIFGAEQRGHAPVRRQEVDRTDPGDLGFFATIMAFVQGETTFYIIRFLLGAAEAGFFPAIILYLTYWFPAKQRVAVLGIFILAQPLANAIGAPISGLLLKMDGIWAWRDGSGCTSSRVFPRCDGLRGAEVAMTDYPRDAMWLTLEERTWLQDKMDAEDAAKAWRAKHSFMAGLKDRRP